MSFMEHEFLMHLHKKEKKDANTCRQEIQKGKRKNIYTVALLLFSLISFSQNLTKHPVNEKRSALKSSGYKFQYQSGINKTDSAHKKTKLVIDSKEYNAAKASGKLAHYEILRDPNKKTVVIKSEYKPEGQVISTLTPCDIVPAGTTNPFPSTHTADDLTSVDETGLYIQLPFTFCFYGNNYTEVNYSSNGNIQFPPSNNPSFNATGFPNSSDQMIAPFWADLDNNGIGQYSIDIFSTYAVFTWGNCGYFNSHTDKTNTFQVVITDGLDPMLPPGKNVGFYYGTMQWTTGDASNGLNGFPDSTLTNPIPATVGMNAGNGIDYLLIGQFGVPGTYYDGPGGNMDGVSWLDGKTFFFNACPPIGSNIEPLPTLLGYCDTTTICGNDTVHIKNTFIAPEVTQNVSITASAPTLASAFSYSVLQNTNSTDIYMTIDGSQATSGYHTVTMTAVDNGIPSLSAVQLLTVRVDKSSASNLNGTIVITPSISLCPGAVINASVTVNGTPGGYLWSNGSGTSSATYTTVTEADSLIFVTLSSGQCQKTITGNINLNPAPHPAIIGNTSFCSDVASTTILTATNTSNITNQGPYIYQWTGTGNLNSANSQSVIATAGVYTVTITNQFGCKSSISTSVDIYKTPDFNISSTNAVYGGSVYCVDQDTARLLINYNAPATCGLVYGSCATPNLCLVGLGVLNADSTIFNPYNGAWKSGKHQYIISASELLAAGIAPGKLTSLSFLVTNTHGFSPVFNNFSIKLKCVSDTSFPAASVIMDNTGLNQVFGPTTVNVTPGWNKYNFIQPYEWDGSSSILMDVCFFNTTTDGNMSISYTPLGYTVTRSLYENADQCPLNDDTNSLSGTSVNRPNIFFENCPDQQPGLQYSVTVTPSIGVSIPSANDSIKIKLPSATGITCYTVQIINIPGNCSKDTVICIQTLQGITQASLVASSYSVCPNQSVVLSAQGALSSYTIQYIDNNGVNSVVNNSVAITAPNATGIYTYTLIATGTCGSVTSIFTNTIAVIAGVTNGSLSATPSVACIGDPVSLSPIGSLSTYTITYNNGSLIHSVNSPVSFNSAVTGLNVYTLTAQGFCNAPINTYTSSVQVNPKLNLFIAPMANITKCLNSSVTLTANVAPSAAEPYTYLWTPAIGTNTNATYTVTSNTTNTYVVTVNGNCANTATTSVVVSNFTDNLTVYILDSASVCANTEFNLNANVSGGRPAYNYNWILLPASAIGNNSPAVSSIAPEIPGTYTVALTVNDSCGYTDFTTQEITVLPPCDIVIPNVITTNNDGKNDVFIIKNLEYHPNSVLTVFDRWGRKLYENSNYQNNWRAESLNDGTYFYTLEVPGDKKYNGFISVFSK